MNFANTCTNEVSWKNQVSLSESHKIIVFMLVNYIMAHKYCVICRILHKQTKFSSFFFGSLIEKSCLEKKTAFFFSEETPMTKSNVHLHVSFELDFQNKTVVFSSVFAKKQQKKGCCLWNCFGTQNVEFHARFFFFWKKFQRCLANVKVLRKKKFFYVLCTLFVCFLNHEPFVKEVGTVLRTEQELFFII